MSLTIRKLDSADAGFAAQLRQVLAFEASDFGVRRCELRLESVNLWLEVGGRGGRGGP